MVTPDGPTTAKEELATFLRGRRERLRPEQVGLPVGGRRRTPGLRREEVAQLAGVGVTWYTWLEQGRDIRPSSSVLDAIAHALQMDPDERDHLWRLATGQPSPAESSTSTYAAVNADHLALLARMMPLPSCIQTASYDILASNASYRFFIDDLDAAPVDDRNCMVRAFLDPSWRRAYGDYEGVTAKMVARLHAAYASHVDNSAWIGLVERMRRESARFDDLWQAGELAHHTRDEQMFHSPRVGPLRVRFVPLWIDRARSIHLKVLHPADAATMTAFEHLAQEVADEPLVTTRPTISAQFDDGCLR